MNGIRSTAAATFLGLFVGLILPVWGIGGAEGKLDKMVDQMATKEDVSHLVKRDDRGAHHDAQFADFRQHFDARFNLLDRRLGDLQLAKARAQGEPPRR